MAVGQGAVWPLEYLLLEPGPGEAMGILECVPVIWGLVQALS